MHRDAASPKRHQASKRQHSRDSPHPMDKRPSFLQWLKSTWLDILTLVLLGAIALTIFRLFPPGRRYFPLTVPGRTVGQSTSELVYPQYAYPLRTHIIPSWADMLLCLLVPVTVILLFQLRIRSFWDANNALIGLAYALILASLFQVVIKTLIGGLRPNFYEVCNPDLTKPGAGYGNYYYTVEEVCINRNNWEVRNALQSFPSGHAVVSTAAALYLSLYLNAKLKIFSDYHPSVWKLALLFFPILGAVLICGSVIIDHTHHGRDIIAGVLIGTAFALASYRMVYASLFDWRTNHIPLDRNAPLIDDGDEIQRADLTATHKAGWGGQTEGIVEDDESLPRPVTDANRPPGGYDGNADESVAGPGGP